MEYFHHSFHNNMHLNRFVSLNHFWQRQGPAKRKDAMHKTVLYESERLIERRSDSDSPLWLTHNYTGFNPNP